MLYLQHTNPDRVLKVMKSLRNDGGTGYNILVSFMKPVAFIVRCNWTDCKTFPKHNWIDCKKFPNQCKVARNFQIPEVKILISIVDFRPSIFLSQVYEQTVLQEISKVTKNHI